jgi:hypothetical protein
MLVRGLSLGMEAAPGDVVGLCAKDGAAISVAANAIVGNREIFMAPILSNRLGASSLCGRPGFGALN